MININAILFDIDGTLIELDEDGYNYSLAQGIAEASKHLITPDEFIDKWFTAAYKTVENEDSRTNYDVFWEFFCSLTQIPQNTIVPICLNYYENNYDALSRHAKKFPEARSVVQQAFSLGLDVIIATNPLYFEIGNIKRLRWGDVDDFPYKLITSLENSCYCKPNLNYYKEICEKIGHPPEFCLMVGNEDGDMVAAKLGCPTFFIPHSESSLNPLIPEPTYQGSLRDLGRVLQNL